MMRFTSPHRAFHQPPGRENARSFTEYASVTALVAQVTDRALLLASEKITPSAWVPIRVMDATSRIKAERAERGREITVRIELEWADKNGLI